MGTTEEALATLLLREELTQWLYREAELLDDGCFQEWLELLAEDVTYTMPLRLNVAHHQLAERAVTRAGTEVLWFDEGKATLAKRVAQLATGLHWAEEPRSRVSHLVTNVRLVEVTLPEVALSCRFVVHRNRVADESDFLVGRRRDRLRRTDEHGWRLIRRELLVDQNVLMAKNLTLFL